MFCCSVVKVRGRSHLRQLSYFSTFLSSCQQLFLTFLSLFRLSCLVRNSLVRISQPLQVVNTFFEVFTEFFQTISILLLLYNKYPVRTEPHSSKKTALARGDPAVCAVFFVSFLFTLFRRNSPHRAKLLFLIRPSRSSGLSWADVWEVRRPSSEYNAPGSADARNPGTPLSRRRLLC